MIHQLWLSHSRIRDFLECPRAYYLNHVFIHPERKRKIQLMTPALALGQVTHRVLESLSVLPTSERFKESLVARFESQWHVVKGLKGGFLSDEVELAYLQRGRAMMQKVMSNPGPLAELAVKIPGDLPRFDLSKEDGLILCGRIDWLQYNQQDNSVHIIDFKTSLREESPDSLQLPIYFLLASETQDRKVTGASYWYLETDDQPAEQELPDADGARQQVLSIGKQIKTAQKLNRFRCPQGETGCRACRPLERIVRGEATFVGEGEFGKDIYVLETEAKEQQTGIVL